MQSYHQRMQVVFYSTTSNNNHQHVPLLLHHHLVCNNPPLIRPLFHQRLSTCPRRKNVKNSVPTLASFSFSGIESEGENLHDVGSHNSNGVKERVMDVASDEAVEGPSSQVVHETATKVSESITNPTQLVEVLADVLADESVTHLASSSNDSSDEDGDPSDMDPDQHKTLPMVDLGSGHEEGSVAADAMTPP